VVVGVDLVPAQFIRAVGVLVAIGQTLLHLRQLHLQKHQVVAVL
jgi:hypothetical protein